MNCTVEARPDTTPLVDVDIGFERFPHTVDLEVNGVCNLACPWCWGPEHHARVERMSTADWSALLERLRCVGSRSVVFTGGEPTLRSDLPVLLARAKALGFRVTLSTNGTLRNALLPVLRWVDDLGLPLDGSTNARNALMRISHHPGVRHFDLVLDTLRQVQADHPAIALTLRTVITAHNVNDVAAIGDTLRSAGIDTTRLRWKLYQVNPIGVRAATVIDGGWEIPDDEVRRLVATLRHRHPRFGEIAYQAAAASRSRYLLVDPAGDAYVVGVDTNGRPARLRIGSAARQWDAFVHALRTHPSRPQDYQHGR